MTLLRVCDSRVLIIICKTPHKMNCFNQRPGNDKIVVCRKAYNKNYYAKEQRANPGPAKTISYRERRDSQITS